MSCSNRPPPGSVVSLKDGRRRSIDPPDTRFRPISLSAFTTKANPSFRAVVALDSRTKRPARSPDPQRHEPLDLAPGRRRTVRRGRTARAQNLEECTRLLGPNDPATLTADYQLGVLLGHLHSPDEAESLLRDCLNRQRTVLGAQHPDDAAIDQSARALAPGPGQLDEADSLAIEYEHGIRCLFGTKHPDNVTALANRGRLRLNQGRLDEASQPLRSGRCRIEPHPGSRTSPHAGGPERSGDRPPEKRQAGRGRGSAP